MTTATAGSSTAEGSPWASVWGAVRYRLDLLLLALAVLVMLSSNVVGMPLFTDAPAGIVGLGLVSGAAIALPAVAIVLVMRSDRIINFAQIQIGLISGLVFSLLVRHNELVWLVHYLVPFEGVSQDGTFLQTHPSAFLAQLLGNGHRGWVVANFWLSAAFALTLAPLLSWAIYRGLMVRFQRSPRVIATVVTIAVGAFAASQYPQITRRVFREKGGQDSDPGQFFVPTDASFTLSPHRFAAGEIAMVVVAVVLVACLWAFLRYTSMGIAIRSTAEFAERAKSLGMNVNAVGGLVWLLAGFLGGAGSMLAVVSSGTSGNPGSVDLTRVLAAAVFARFASLPLAVLAALALGVIDQGLFWGQGNGDAFQLVLFAFILVSLLLQRSKLSRAETEATAAFLSAQETRPIPPVLRRLPAVQSYLRWGAVVAATVVLGLPFVLDPGQVSISSVIVIYAMVGLSLLVLTGWAGQISLGQFGISAAGAVVAAVLTSELGLNAVLAILAGGLAGALTAVVLGVPSLRLHGLHLAVATYSFAVVVSTVLLGPGYAGRVLPSSVPRPFLLGVDLSDEKFYFYFCLLWLAAATLVVVGLRRSRTARALIAARDNEGAAQSFGINLYRARLEAFAVSGLLAGVAGALFAFNQQSVQPLAFDAGVSTDLFLVAVIGGLGSVAGPLLGAVYQGLFTFLADSTISGLAVAGGALLVLLVIPGGLNALAARTRDAILRRVAIRHRLSVPGLLGSAGDPSSVLAPLRPVKRSGGGPVYVPRRYRLDPQWTDYRSPR